MDPFMCYPYFHLAKLYLLKMIDFVEDDMSLMKTGNINTGFPNQESYKTNKILPDQPYLFIWGQQKRVAFHSKELLREITNRRDGSQFVCLKNAGHNVHQDDPEGVNCAIEDF